MKVFFALCIVMGLVHKPDIDQYWTTDLATETPWFPKHMTRDRFSLILSYLHLIDNELQPGRDEPGFDKLSKVRPFVSMLRVNSSHVYTPGQNLSFDEGGCPWRGRLSWKCYNPNKPNKFHIKLYTVCDAECGFIHGFDIYTGSTESVNFADILDIDPDCTLTTKIVLGLMSHCGLLNKGYHVYMDNYYTSPELFTELDTMDTYACGTLRMNRKQVPKAMKLKLKKGEIVFRRRGNMFALKWHDKRNVSMLSTIHDADEVLLDKRDRNGEPIVKPSCLYDYVKKMGGVDVIRCSSTTLCSVKPTSTGVSCSFIY
jgi:hypothetical protein